MSFVEQVRAAITTGDLAPVIAEIPYMAAMGMQMQVREGELIGVMRFSEHLIGNYAIRALHGGTVGALLESTAAFELIWQEETEVLPRIVNITVEYLRSAKDKDLFAHAEITKQGRRVANVRVVAWQDERSKPVAAANAHFLLTPR